MVGRLDVFRLKTFASLRPCPSLTVSSIPPPKTNKQVRDGSAIPRILRGVVSLGSPGAV